MKAPLEREKHNIPEPSAEKEYVCDTDKCDGYKYDFVTIKSNCIVY